MKSLLSAACVLSVSTFTVFAAPRLVVSTASLVPESKVDVVFEQPVVAADGVGKADDIGVEITPEWPGKWEWKSSDIAAFVPNQPPAIGARYQFRMVKGKKHADGSAIVAGKFGEAQAEQFKAVSANSPHRWEAGYSIATGEWIVVFNDDVDPATAASSIHFEAEKIDPVPVKAERVNAETAGWYGRANKPWSARGKPSAAPPAADEMVPHVLRVRPEFPLVPAKHWRLVVGKGLRNAPKSAATQQDAVYQIGEVQPFIVASVTPVVEVNQPRVIRISFNHPLAENAAASLLEQHIVVSPRPKDLKAEVKGRSVTLGGAFVVGTDYYVTVRGPLQSLGGLPLAAESNQNVEFHHLDSELALPSEQQGQLAHGSRAYAIYTVNLAKVNLRVKQLSGIDLVRAVQGYQNYTGAGHENQEISPAGPLPWPLVAGAQVASKEFNLDNSADTARVIDLKWDEILPKKTTTGTFFVEATGEPKDTRIGDKLHRRSAQAIVQLTDIGLSWKFTRDEVLVHAFSCRTGGPLPGVKLTMYGDDAAVLDEAATDPSGLARLPRRKTSRHLAASKDADSYVTAFDSSAATIGMWHFPVRYAYSTPPEKQRRVFFFTDRSVYRPGETVRVKGIIRELAGNTVRMAPAAKAELAIVDPTGKELLRTPVKISEKGSFDFTHQLAPARVGDHRIHLDFPDDRKRLEDAERADEEGRDAELSWEERDAIETSARFTLPLRVEDFRRNAFEITQKAGTPAIGAANVDVSVSAKYYQGEPVASGKVKYYSQVTERNLYPERFSEFLFGDHRVDDWRYWYHYFNFRDDESSGAHSHQLAGETKLAADGGATIRVEVPASGFPRTSTVEIATEITDANHQTLTSRTETTVHPAQVNIGVSRVDRLVRAGEVLPLKFVAVDNDGEPFGKPVKFTATLTREINRAVKSRTDSGATTTRNDVAEEPVSTAEVVLDPAASKKDGQAFDLTPKLAGLHYLTVRGKDESGREFATVTRFHVYGTEEYPWKYEEGLRVKIVADKKSYQPGETARVLVLTPIEGRALVTIEREKVLRSFTTELKMNNPVIDIPLTDDDAPNAYVSVLLVKGSEQSAREVKEPQLRLGYCELIVEPRRETLAVEIDQPAASYRPGERITISGIVKRTDGSPAKDAEVTLYAEDEGTLAVMGYETPDPMAYFYRPRVLAVESGTSFDTFLAENPEARDFFNKGFFVGGGGEAGKPADPRRKNFDPCATWAASLSAGTDGRFTHTFVLPDTLTRYRVMAVAHHEGPRFGKGESAIVAKKDIMLEPKSPRAANQGDTIQPQVMIQNSSDTAGTWEVRLIAHDAGGTPVCRAVGPVSESVHLAPGESKTVSFPVKVETTGTAMVAWQVAPVKVARGSLDPATTRRLSDSVRTTFSSSHPMPIIRDVRFVKLDNSARPLDLRKKLAENLLDGSGTLELELSRSRLTEAAGAVDEVLRYPYGCVEQTTSSLLPWCSVEALRKVVPRFANVPQKTVERALQSGANRLLGMQLQDGSFSYWPGDMNRADWATPYAGMGLVLAAKAGAEVPQSALDALIQVLGANLRGAGSGGNQWETETRVRALYTLALAGKPDISYQNNMADRAASLTPTARALLAAAITAGSPDDEDARELAKRVLTTRGAPEPDGSNWMAHQPDDALTLLAWMSVDPEDEKTIRALDRMFAKRSPYGGWVTTWANGWSLHALARFAAFEPAGDEPVTVTVETNSGTETIVLSPDAPVAKRHLPLGVGMRCVVSADKPTFIRTNIASQPRIQPVQPVAKNGLAIDRVYQLVHGDGSMVPLDQPKPGDLIRVTLRVTLPRDDARYLAIDDPLPATFEAVNSRFQSQSAALGIRTSERSWNISHSELRDDRAVFFIDHVRKAGTYTLTYLARCTLPGQVIAPPAKAEMMYDPGNFALSASRGFDIR
ncbi:MAG: MG2 domain-containing protein [Verrucomicrobiota bacterium]